MFHVVKKLGLVGIVVAGIASRSDAGIITVPPSLAPGAQYRLVFVTSGTSDALSNVVADYNTFVTNQANTNAALTALGTTWRAIASVASIPSTVNAVDNVGATAASVGIYRLDGIIVSPNTTSMFSGAISNPVLLNQSGSANTDSTVWTGSNSHGTADFGLGAASHQADFGDSAASNGQWLAIDTFPTEFTFSLYAVSGVLTVPSTSVPEPGSVGLTALGGAVLLLAARRKTAN